jgi:hypothetical protein
MIGLPWFLLAIGIVLLLVGAMLAVLRDASRRKPLINPKMRNKDIARHLRNEQRVSVPALIFYAGLACIAVSLGWRFMLGF